MKKIPRGHECRAGGTAFLPFLCRSPARSDTCLFFTRMTTTPSGINVNIILSPALIPRPSRIGLGIVVCPLLVSVASVLMAISGILTRLILVRNKYLRKSKEKFAAKKDTNERCSRAGIDVSDSAMLWTKRSHAKGIEGGRH